MVFPGAVRSRVISAAHGRWGVVRSVRIWEAVVALTSENGRPLARNAHQALWSQGNLGGSGSELRP